MTSTDLPFYATTEGAKSSDLLFSSDYPAEIPSFNVQRERVVFKKSESPKIVAFQ